MAHTIHGTFSLAQMLDFTYHSKYANRFVYQKRDIIKRITIIKEIELQSDRLHQPNIKLIIQTRSYPQYGPYTKEKRGTKQRKYLHDYDSTLELKVDDNGQFSMYSTDWTYRLGTQKKWVNRPAQAEVKTVYRETLKQWTTDRDRVIKIIESGAGSAKYKKQAIDRENKKLKEKIKKHRESAPYLDVGDFNAKKNGVNGDFFHRVAPILQQYGHLYGRNVKGDSQCDLSHPFLPKHALNLIDALLKLNILIS